MRASQIIAALSLAGAMMGSAAFADGHGGYTAGDLLSPCQEADNDARWGETAELECEQYIMGYVAALRAVGAKEQLGICAPEQNTADEVRWAFMRWVHESYTARLKMSAQDAVMETLKANFACAQ